MLLAAIHTPAAGVLRSDPCGVMFRMCSLLLARLRTTVGRVGEMEIAGDSAAALTIIEAWEWDGPDPRFEFHVSLRMPLSDVVNRLAMEGHPDPAAATLTLLADGKLEATGSYRWMAYRNGHYQRDGVGQIPPRRWAVLQELQAECEDPFGKKEVTLHLIGGDWHERKEKLAEWNWNSDHFTTAQVSAEDWLDKSYFEETFYAADIEVRPAGPGLVSDGQESIAAERNKGGAPCRYDWERAVAAIVFHWADEGSWQPKLQADVRNRLAEWFAERDQHPSESLLKDRARWLFEEFHRRGGEASNLAA